MTSAPTHTLTCPVQAVSALIGNTPLLEIHYRHDGLDGRIFAKYESENMTGSIKDRMAMHILCCAYRDGQIKPGDTIVEATSGNTGISFAAVGRALGHNVRIYMPEWMSTERKQLIACFGAEVIPVSREQGGFVGSVRLAEEDAQRNADVFLPRQFSNPANLEAHVEGTGPEIERQLATFDLAADVFVAGVGTGGTVMGVGRYLNRNGRTVRVHPLEPANSPTLRTGVCVGKHRIQGISDEFIPQIVQLDELDEIVDVWDGDAILMAQKLCRTLGLAVGISSGANIIGAIKLQQQLGGDAVVVTVLPDSNKKYLSTDLAHEEPVRDEYWSPAIDLHSFTAIRRS